MTSAAELTHTLEELARRRRENQAAYYKPYERQIEFHAMGATKRERALSAGNQQGKSEAGGAELSFHLTGRYPPWWTGRRFESAITAWAAGVTSESTRDVVQKKLLGVPDESGGYGSGFVPKDAIISVTMGRGINGAADTVLVRHVGGNASVLQFKSYERGREKWQGASVEVLWLDEEPPLDIYSEGLARIAARKGIIYLTATPLLGLSGVQARFFNETHEDRGLVRMSIADALHIAPEERQRIEDGYLPHERDARVRGLPMLGSGRVFPVTEESITTPAFALPGHWPRICGIDLGYDHPFAAAWLAWDRDTDKVYVTDTYRERAVTMAIHVAAIRARGDVVVAWPHDGLQHDRTAGEPMAALYKKMGLQMLPERATFPDGGNSVEAGVLDMLDRMQTGRFKVFAHLGDWIEEFRLYHRKEGRLVKERDDLLSATRYALMSLRHARTADRMPGGRGRGPGMATGIDYDLTGDREDSRGGSRRDAEIRHRALTFPH